MSTFELRARELGLDRVLEPEGALPQTAIRVNADPHCQAHEIALDVHRLVLDAASARQLVEAYGSDGVPAAVKEVVRRRGKMHNDVTGSGGMAFANVAEIGKACAARDGLEIGDRVATLCSLSLTPLSLDVVEAFDPRTHQLLVRGRAVLPSAASLARIPEDLPLTAVLAALDVAGAPAHVGRMAHTGGDVLLLGAGNAGLLSLMAARAGVGPSGRILVVDANEAACERARSLAAADAVICADARDFSVVAKATFEHLSNGADLTVVVVNVPGCEPAAYLATNPSGTILFFSMATSFTAAALGAEGVASPVRMLIGNGYSPDRGEVALSLLREHPRLRAALDGAGPDTVSA